LGTPAVTTRGFKEKEIVLITGWIADVLDHIEDEKTISRVKERVLKLCREFPVYG